MSRLPRNWLRKPADLGDTNELQFKIAEDCECLDDQGFPVIRSHKFPIAPYRIR
jgi:hypothetical protein